MQKLLFAIMTSFGRVFATTFLVAVTGILTAPNQSAAIALSLAAFIASLCAALRAVQVFIPAISFAQFLNQPMAAWADSFVRAFLSVFVILLTGWLAAPDDWSAWKSAITAVIIGALTAGVRALQGLSTPGELPHPASGVTVRA